jgi:16S rRNA (uracil1498-N3)-methyltransferase
MKRILNPQLPAPGSRAALSESEARHAVSVLRLRDGERVLAMDGQGHAVHALLRVRGKTVELEYESDADGARAASQLVPVTLELAVLKGDAMEWAIEKAVELGIERLVPVLTAHTVAQVDRKGPGEFQRRWQRIADQALKQCGRLQALEVEPPTELAQLLSRQLGGARRLWCDDQGRAEAPALWRWLVEHPDWGELRLLVGPEGGFSDRERELLLRTSEAVSLGPLTLRAETAALEGVALTSAQFRARG